MGQPAHGPEPPKSSHNTIAALERILEQEGVELSDLAKRFLELGRIQILTDQKAHILEIDGGKADLFEHDREKLAQTAPKCSCL